MMVWSMSQLKRDPARMSTPLLISMRVAAKNEASAFNKALGIHRRQVTMPSHTAGLGTIPDVPWVEPGTQMTDPHVVVSCLDPSAHCATSLISGLVVALGLVLLTHVQSDTTRAAVRCHCSVEPVGQEYCDIAYAGCAPARKNMESANRNATPR